jgi:hypothetical protein
MATIDTEQFRQIDYDIFYNGIFVGATTTGSTVINIGPNRVAVEDASQIRGAIKLWRAGMVITVNLQLKEVAPAKLSSLILQGENVEISGASTKYNLGNQTIDMDDYSGELLLQPTGQDLSDTSDSWKFYKAVAVNPFTYTGNNETPQVVDMVFEILPDTTKSIEKYFGAHNNWDISQANPTDMFITMAKTSVDLQIPPKTLTACTLTPGQQDKLQCWEFQKTDSSTTAAINEAGDITSTDTTFDFDTLNIANGIVANSYILIDTEVMYVSALTYATSITGTFDTVVRAVAGTDAAAHLDDAVITLLENVSFTNRTTEATWATSDDTKVDVGDVYTSNTNTKGVIEHVAAGSANITATFQTIATDNCVVTAT